MRFLRFLPILIVAACGGDAVAPTALTGVDTLATGTPASGSTGPCSATTALSLAVGDVRALTAAQAGSLCVSGGSGAEYALVPVNTRGASGASLALTINGVNTSAITGASLASLPAGGAAGAGGISLGADAALLSSRFDARLRSSERGLFRSRAAGARLAALPRSSTGGALFSVASAATAVGDLLRLNANSDQGCTSPSIRTGRVVAVTNNAIVVADTANPAGGFTDAEYKSLGVAFDTLVYPLDTLNFGAPADIDGNGRVVIFYTKAVNDLTPATSTSYIGGFFYGRDLYPKAATSSLPACAGSNVAEMFYMMVPEPSRAGSSTSSPFAKASVAEQSTSVLAHELQHLINESRRLYVTKTDADEETWLNEGLSHIAEELAFYRVAGLSPRQNLTLATLRAGGTRAIDGFNQYESSNFGRLLEYLPATESNSPVADNDSLSTRGASWQLLRYAADRKGGTERDTWHALVNSSTSGLTNLQNVFGAAAFGGTRPWLRDWAVSNFTDDAGFTVASAYTQPSWNFRSLLPAITNKAYPVVTHSLVAGTPVSLSLLGGGGTGYVRFAVASGATATVTTGTGSSGTAALPTTLDAMLVRTK